MKDWIIVIGILLFGFSGFSQKVKLNESVATVNGEEYVFYEKRNMANEASVRGIQADQEEVYIMYMNYVDPNRVSSANPEGKVRWLEVNFLTLDLKCEVENRTHKAMVKLFYENDLFTNGVINPEKARLFCKKYGTKFSDNRPGGNVNIIINH